jgi:hypothetical protein
VDLDCRKFACITLCIRLWPVCDVSGTAFVGLTVLSCQAVPWPAQCSTVLFVGVSGRRGKEVIVSMIMEWMVVRTRVAAVHVSAHVGTSCCKAVTS